MLQRRTLIVFAMLLIAYGMLLLPALLSHSYSDSFAGIFVRVPIISLYVFHQAGVSGLLEHNGLCGWGWCRPTLLGWSLAAVFWLVATWLVAWGVASLTRLRLAPTSMPHLRGSWSWALFFQSGGRVLQPRPDNSSKPCPLRGAARPRRPTTT